MFWNRKALNWKVALWSLPFSCTRTVSSVGQLQHTVEGGKRGRQGHLVSSSKSVWGKAVRSLLWAVTQHAILWKHFDWWHLTYLRFSEVSLRGYEMAVVIPILQTEYSQGKTTFEKPHIW